MSLIKKRTATGRPRTGGVKFEYRARTPEQVRALAQRQIGGRDSYFNSDIVFFTAREGDNNVRILPPPPDADWGHYGVSIACHYDIGPDKSAYLCRDKMLSEECPICAERAAATAAGEDDFADVLKPGYRTAVYIIDRNQEGKGPMLWNVSGGLDKDITKLCIDPATGEILPVDDPNDGYDLAFVREGTGLKTKYKGVQFARKASPLSDDPEAAEAWLEHIVAHPIDKCLVYHEYDYIKKVLEGQAPAADTDAEAAKPAAGAKAKLARKAAEPAATGGRPRIQPRGKAAAPATEAVGLPTYDDVQSMDEDTLAALGEEQELEFPEGEGFGSIEELRAWICEQLGLEGTEPESAPEPAAGKASWRDKLRKQTGGK